VTNEVAEQRECRTRAGKRVFRPRSTPAGWISSAALLGLFAAVAVPAFPLVASPNLEERIVPYFLCLFASPVFFFTLILPTMRYEVDEDKVELRCGPFHWSVPAASIRKVYEMDLQYLPLSEGWKLPGYTLFRIRYGDVDKVRMCATAMCTRILIIETDQERWGVTPADVQGFVAAICPQDRG
jgi:hypothetical protein